MPITNIPTESESDDSNQPRTSNAHSRTYAPIMKLNPTLPYPYLLRNAIRKPIPTKTIV